MNDVVRDIVRTNVPDAGTELSFVKFNTAGSPLRTTPNVLFFCFDGGQLPRWCLKTVRAPRDNAIITKSFADLQALYRLSGANGIFPRPIWAGEDDGIAWSIEEAVPGHRASAAEIPQVLKTYIEFQRTTGIVGTIPAKEKAAALIQRIDLSAAECAQLQALCEAHCRGAIALIPQHGDFTPDNVLVSASRISIVDCDSFMPEGVAGFDMFHFLSRIPHAIAHISEYMRLYTRSLGIQREFDACDLLVWLLQERVLKQEQGAPRDQESIVHAFDRWRPRFEV